MPASPHILQFLSSNRFSKGRIPFWGGSHRVAVQGSSPQFRNTVSINGHELYVL